MNAVTSRRISTAVGFALVVTGLGSFAPAQAAPSADEWRAPLTQAPTGTEVVAASGKSVLVFVDDVGYRLSTDNGGHWAAVDLGTDDDDWWSRPSYVRAGQAIWADGVTIQTLDLKTGDVSTRDLSGLGLGGGDYDTPIMAATPQGAIAYKGEDPYLLTFPDSLTPITTQSLPQPPAGAYDAYLRWRLDEHRGYALTSHQNRSDTATIATDVDPVALDGSADGSPFRITGQLLDMVGGAGSVRYLVRTSSKVQDCTQTLATPLPKPTCTTLASAKASSGVDGSYVGSVALARVGSTWYSLEAGKLHKVVIPKGASGSWWGMGDPERPLLQVGAKSSRSPIYQVDNAGKLHKLFDAVDAPMVPDQLSVSADRLVGIDRREGDRYETAWARSITSAGIGNESVLSKRASEALTSAGRYAVSGKDGLSFYDRGAKTTTGKVVSQLWSLSGPYPAVTIKNKDYMGTPLATYKRLEGSAVATFGSRVVAGLRNSDDYYTTLRLTDVLDSTVRVDLALPTTGLDEAEFYQAGLWGDRLVATVVGVDPTTEDTGESVWVADLGTKAWTMLTDDADVLGVGDGFALLALYDDETNLVAFSLDSGDPVLSLDGVSDGLDVVGVSTDTVAYATDSELVVRKVPGAGGSAPRVLGTIAPAGCNAWDCAWSPQIDTTKPLAAGHILIKDAQGNTVRSIDTPASPDGSLRVAWDGRLDAGQPTAFATVGTYTWALDVPAADGTGAVVALDGTSVPGGTIKVTRKAVGKVKFGKISLTSSKPKVDDVVTAKVASVFPKYTALTYTWYAGKTKVQSGSDEAALSYQVKAADLSKTLKFVVTGSREGATTASASASTKAVAKAAFKTTPVGTVTAVDLLLTVETGEWLPTPDAFAYQWYSVSASGKLTSIAGATAKSFQATTVGIYRAKVTAKKAGYADTSVLSATHTIAE